MYAKELFELKNTNHSKSSNATSTPNQANNNSVPIFSPNKNSSYNSNNNSSSNNNSAKTGNNKKTSKGSTLGIVIALLVVGGIVFLLFDFLKNEKKFEYIDTQVTKYNSHGTIDNSNQNNIEEYSNFKENNQNSSHNVKSNNQQNKSIDVRKRGWVIENGFYHYYDNNGNLVKNNWVDNDFYVDGNGNMLTNFPINWNGEIYYVGQDGRYVKNYEVDMAGSTFYFGNDGKMYRNQIRQTNYGTFFYNEKGQLVKNQWAINPQTGKYNYFGGNGAMYVDTITPDGVMVDRNGEKIAINNQKQSENVNGDEITSIKRTLDTLKEASKQRYDSYDDAFYTARSIIKFRYYDKEDKGIKSDYYVITGMDGHDWGVTIEGDGVNYYIVNPTFIK